MCTVVVEDSMAPGMHHSSTMAEDKHDNSRVATLTQKRLCSFGILPFDTAKPIYAAIVPSNVEPPIVVKDPADDRSRLL